MKHTVLNMMRRIYGTKQILDHLDYMESQYVLKDGELSASDSTAIASDPSTVTKAIRLALTASAPESFFLCNVNGVSAWLPAETLKTMIHCVHSIGEDITVWVETAHINWMMDRLSSKKRALFVDVGAATGAATIPIALRFKDIVSIIAFEPATNARQLLSSTLDKNGIHSVNLVNSAVSDSVGEVAFIEYGEDSIGNCPYLPEVSTIAYEGARSDDGVIKTVQCTTLDHYFSANGLFEKDEFDVVVVKIDVEGFEEHVLKGASNFIKEIKPYFSIDIHRSPGGEGTTEEACRELLSQFGYTFEKMAHVLLASSK